MLFGVDSTPKTDCASGNGQSEVLVKPSAVFVASVIISVLKRT